MKDASFSIDTSAEEASRALFALAGVTYVPPTSAKPVAAAADDPAVDSSSPLLHSLLLPRMRKRAWLLGSPPLQAYSSPTSLRCRACKRPVARLAPSKTPARSGTQGAGGARRGRKADGTILQSTRRSHGGAEVRTRGSGEEGRARGICVASLTLLGSRFVCLIPPSPFCTFCAGKQLKRRGLRPNMPTHASITATAPQMRRPPPLPSPPPSPPSLLPPLSLLPRRPRSFFASSIPSSLSSFDVSWNDVLSMLPSSAMSRNNGVDLARMKMMYMQLKAAKRSAAGGGRGAAEEEQESGEEEEKKGEEEKV